MKTATITWVNSLTTNVDRHIIYRDDIQIGIVFITEPSIFVDSNAVQGIEYKYEVQASTALDAESSKEVIDINVKIVIVNVISTAYIYTTSKSATWNPLIINSGGILTWEVSGGVTIAPHPTNSPSFDLSSNTGTAVVKITATDYFAGVTELIVNNMEVTSMSILQMTKLENIGVQGTNKLTALDISTLTVLTRLNIIGQNLTEINTDNNILLASFEFTDNNISTLDVNNNPIALSVHLENNNLVSTVADKIVNDLAAGNISNGSLKLEGNEALTSVSSAGYTELIARFWFIDVQEYGEPNIPTDLEGEYVINIPTGIDLIYN